MSQKFTRKQVAERTDKKTLFVIDNVVYDVTPFLDEHPGGHEVLVNVSGKDASVDFDDIGHSLDAKELMKKYAVGELVDEDKKEVKKKYVSWEQSGGSGEQSAGAGGLLGSWKLPVLLALLATVVYSYVFA